MGPRHRRRASAVIAGFLAFASICATHGGREPFADLTSRAKAAPAALRVCTPGDYPPLSYRDLATGQHSGIDVDMANDFATYLGRETDFVATTWGSLAADMTTPGKCDIAVGGISKTSAREQVADFTQYYLTTGKAPLTTAADAERLQTADQINQPGVRVIENAGGTNERFARQAFPRATLIVWPDNTTVFDQLLQHQADVMVTDSLEAVYQSKQRPGLVVAHPDQPFTADQKAYMLPKGSPLTAQADQWLARALANGTFQRSYDRWTQ